jgi:hypothetical protein
MAAHADPVADPVVDPGETESITTFATARSALVESETWIQPAPKRAASSAARACSTTVGRPDSAVTTSMSRNEKPRTPVPSALATASLAANLAAKPDTRSRPPAPEHAVRSPSVKSRVSRPGVRSSAVPNRAMSTTSTPTPTTLIRSDRSVGTHGHLFDGDSLREVAWLVDVPAELDGDVVTEQLQRDHR